MSRLLLIIGVTLVVAGCESEQSTDSKLPWAQPQAWEQQLPGMSGMGTGGR